MRRIITLTTDFGLQDGFVGMMKGVILGINPAATIVDITHEVAPQNIEHGAFLFAASSQFFPPNAIHVVVVDPGVGSARRPIAIQAGETLFVGPDNGVLSRAIANYYLPNLRAVHLNRPEYWLARVSHTFHGRDVFAPVAAHLSLGVPIESLGTPIDDWVRLEGSTAIRHSDGSLVGKVVHIDRFGNIVLNVLESELQGMDRERLEVEIGGRVVKGMVRTYAEARAGELVALISSSGDLEVAAREGNAAQLLGVKTGDEAVVRG